MDAERRNEPHRTTLQRGSDTELLITRTFRAPAHVVFDAWTKAEHVRRWWAPASRGLTVVECDADVRPGGSYRYVLAREGGWRMAFLGTYLEVARPTRLAYTQRLEPGPATEVVVTIDFEERAGVTTLTARERYPSKEALDGGLRSGMEDGMNETLAQLDVLVASLGG
jgi:uncharacterized protein YndB with AHSA1/START domain